MWGVATKELTGKGGKVEHLKGVEVAWQKDDTGRWQMQDRPGTEFTINADLVLLAMGFTGPRKSRLLEEQGISFNARGTVDVGEDHMTSVNGLFAAGDMALGQSLIVRALADGRQTAAGIVRYLQDNKRTTLS